MNTRTDISNSAEQYLDIVPKTLIHEASSTLFYIGVSISGGDTTKAIWSIKKIEKVGNVWAIALFPSGDQTFKFVWDDRLGYTYS